MTADRMILGENYIYSTDSRETGLNNNVTVAGGSGCGKTMSVLEAILLEMYHANALVEVTKRRVVDKYIPVFEQRGYHVKDYNLANPMKSNCAYDPFKYVRSYSDIDFLAKAIVMADPRKKNSNLDPYWDQAGILLLKGLIAYVLMKKGAKAKFSDVLYLFDQLKINGEDDGCSTSLDDKFEALAEEKPGCYAIVNWNSFRSLPRRTAGCVYGTLSAAIKSMFSPELKKMIADKPAIDFEKTAREKTIIFVTTSPVNPSIHCFANMFFAQAIKSLFEYAESQPDGTLPFPMQLLFDDFATGSRILNFPEYISIFREKKMSATLLIQSESQLASMYGPDDATTIINNCDSYIYMGGMDLKTGISVSQRLDVPLSDVLSMPVGHEVIFRRGMKPVVTERYNIQKNDQYQKISADYERRIEEKRKEKENPV